jgi:virginiamycin B lyase
VLRVQPGHAGCTLIWFTGFSSNQIGRITLDGTIERFPVPTSKSMTYHIAPGPDGALWFTEQAGNKIGRFDIPLAQTGTNTR